MKYDELVQMCQKIKEDHGNAYLTYGLIEVPDDKIDTLLVKMRDAHVFTCDIPDEVGGFRGERIPIDHDIPIRNVNILGFVWDYTNMLSGISVSLQLSIVHGDERRIAYVREYSLNVLVDENQVNTDDDFTFSTSVYIAECSETGYEGHQLSYGARDGGFADKFMQAIKEAI